MKLERITNISNLIQEHLHYLLDRSAIALIGLLITFTVLIQGIFLIYSNGLHLHFIVSLWIGSIISIVSSRYSFQLGFKLLRKRDLNVLSKPNKLIELYFSSGLLIALFMITIHLVGFFFVFAFFIKHSIIYYLSGICIVSFFIRLGAGIFAKGADISSSLISNDQQESPGINDYRNVSSIADKIGDFFNNGIALNLDLTDSLIGIITAIITYLSVLYFQHQIPGESFISMVTYPLVIILGSIIISIFSGFLILFLQRRSFSANSLKPLHGIYVSLFLITLFTLFTTLRFNLNLDIFTPIFQMPVYLNPFFAVFLGILLSVIIGITTDYYTSDSHQSVQEIVKFSEYSSTMTELNGTAVGMKSLNLPIITATIFILLSFKLAGYYGIMLMATGLLSMVTIIIAGAIYAPFIDNITGLVKMESETHPVDDPDITPLIIGQYEHLNSIGNTLSALAKNYASNAVLVVVFSLFIPFIRMSGLNYQSIAIFHPVIISALFLGSLLPYILSATLIRGVSFTIIEMFDEAVLQLEKIPYLKELKTFPDVHNFINKSGTKIIRSLILPALLVLFLPILIGKLFCIEILSALFIGMMISGVFLSISYTNTGAVLDNAKKLLEKGYFGGCDTQTYKNAVSGDLFGDSLKDLVGPSLNNFSKLIIVMSLIIIPIII